MIEHDRQLLLCGHGREGIGRRACRLFSSELPGSECSDTPKGFGSSPAFGRELPASQNLVCPHAIPPLARAERGKVGRSCDFSGRGMGAGEWWGVVRGLTAGHAATSSVHRCRAVPMPGAILCSTPEGYTLGPLYDPFTRQMLFCWYCVQQRTTLQILPLRSPSTNGDEGRTAMIASRHARAYCAL